MNTIHSECKDLQQWHGRSYVGSVITIIIQMYTYPVNNIHSECKELKQGHGRSYIGSAITIIIQTYLLTIWRYAWSFPCHKYHMFTVLRIYMHVCGVYTDFWQGDHQTYGYIQCICTVQANPADKQPVHWKVQYFLQSTYRIYINIYRLYIYISEAWNRGSNYVIKIDFKQWH